jgi:hypothetical protein
MGKVTSSGAALRVVCEITAVLGAKVPLRYLARSAPLYWNIWSWLWKRMAGRYRTT